MHKLRFRQVHLDFHTSPVVERIGEVFDKKQWQQALKAGHVNSITCFSKCHHGWSYHPTIIGKQHPHLKFDLLHAQYDAAKEIDVNVPIYLSAGMDNVASHIHPEWREVNAEGRYAVGFASDSCDRNILSEFEVGFHKMCFNSPYLDYLCEQIQEVVKLFPGTDGIFLDIIYQGQCYCQWCRTIMKSSGLDINVEEDREKCAKMALDRYYHQATAACRNSVKDMPVFHNSGHIQRGNRETLKYFSHLELESLPNRRLGV